MVANSKNGVTTRCSKFIAKWEHYPHVCGTMCWYQVDVHVLLRAVRLYPMRKYWIAIKIKLGRRQLNFCALHYRITCTVKCWSFYIDYKGAYFRILWQTVTQTKCRTVELKHGPLLARSKMFLKQIFFYFSSEVI